MAAAETAIALDPRLPDAWLAHAAARVASHDLAGAREDLDRAVMLDPRRADIVLARAQLETWLPDLVAAEADATRALFLNPGFAEAFVTRGRIGIALAQGDPVRYQAAIDDFNRALALEPASWTARLGRAEVWIDRAAFRGDPADLDRALHELDTLKSGAAATWASLLRSRVLAMRGDSDAARQERASVGDAAPSRGLEPIIGDSGLVDAWISAGARDWAAAASMAQSMLDRDPRQWIALRLVADAYLQMGMTDAALAAADALLVRRPDDLPALTIRATALQRLGKLNAAAAALDDAAAIATHSPVFQARIGQVRDLLGAGSPSPT